MAETDTKEEEEPSATASASASPMFVTKLMSKRRTWVCLFVLVYTILLFSSWTLLKSILSWYNSTTAAAARTQSSSGFGWPEIYASVLLGVVFGLLSMGAALAVAVPATLVTWITILVLLALCGKPRKALVVEGKKLTAEITGFVLKVLIKEGNVVAAVCAVLGYFLLSRKNRENGANLEIGI